MAKKVNKRELREQRREEERAEREAAEAKAQKRLRLMRLLVAVVPLVTLAFAIPTWLVLESPRAAALLAVVGVAVWIPVLLGGLGSAIEPRDRTRAGSIDFGHRK